MFEQILQATQTRRYNVTNHADEEIQKDRLSLRAVLDASQAGEIIESYLEDCPFLSYLVLGFTPSGDPVHAVWAFDERAEIAVLVPVYPPDPMRWIEYRVRRKSP